MLKKQVTLPIEDVFHTRARDEAIRRKHRSLTEFLLSLLRPHLEALPPAEHERAAAKNE